ncbi:MAG: TonB family protein, partial [Ilumatobacteraceae bacterium]
AGHPLAGVELGVAGGGLRGRTDDRGEYRLAGVVAGPATLTARHIGFRPYSYTLRLLAGTEHYVDVVLQTSPAELEAVAVTARREVYDSRLAGFNARMQQKVGHFVTRERIDRANSANLSDMLREIPGIKIGPMRNEGRAIRFRGSSCPPLVFVDGFPATAGEFDVDIIDLQSVEGIEVYAGLGVIPPEFTGPRDLDRCGVIAIWSRPSRDRRRASARPEPKPDSAASADLSDVLTHDQVDLVARLDTGSSGPRYPDSLYKAGTPGRVVVEFVVDTAGRVEPNTIEVLMSSHALFAASVREALLAAHFQAAWAKGRRVRQFVQLPFSFMLDEASGVRRPFQ